VEVMTLVGGGDEGRLRGVGEWSRRRQRDRQECTQLSAMGRRETKGGRANNNMTRCAAKIRRSCPGL